jgi:hypothetical protein
MPRRIRLESYLTYEELHDRYRRAGDPVDRSQWYCIWLLSRGFTDKSIAAVTGYSAYWFR